MKICPMVKHTHLLNGHVVGAHWNIASIRLLKITYFCFGLRVKKSTNISSICNKQESGNDIAFLFLVNEM